MTLNLLVSEVQGIRQNVENAYYELLTLRKATKFAQVEGQQVEPEQILKTIDNALARLEKVVEG